MNIVLDFDRTLFDTSKFTMWFAGQVAQRAGKTAEVIHKEAVSTYYMYEGDLYYYDMHAHMDAIFGEQAEAVLAEIHALAVAHESFLYEDVRRTLMNLKGLGDVHILTFGEENYQQFKLSLCPELADLPTTIVQSAKGPHLAEQFEDSVRCIFVDDKDEHGLLPDWVEFYHLRRGSGSDSTSESRVISSFDQLVQIISLKEGQ